MSTQQSSIQSESVGVSRSRGPSDIDSTSASAPHVAVLIVTWNRERMVSNVLDALSRQEYPLERLDVVVIDNASTDGTTEFLIKRWRPERVVANDTDRAHEPAFEVERPANGTPNAGGFGSLTLIRNAHNHGGCGGFNTGFAYVAEHLDRAASPEFVWLVDDDIDLPTDALAELTRVAATDERIGLVGSRTKHIDQRQVTIESTIYFNPDAGVMNDHPEPGHRLFESHEAWVREVGGPKGEHELSGTREVDVVSACSMLARWSAVRDVGFWDKRFFIYCDDADWCLRFAQAGHKVVINLDAVVYHTPWHHKLTPARLYYAQRNSIWMVQKIMPAGRVKRSVGKLLNAILLSSINAAMHRRMFHAELMRRAALDVVTDTGGKLEDDGGPTPEPIDEALKRLADGRSRTRIIQLCRAGHFLPWAAAMRARAAEIGLAIEWIEAVPNTISEEPTAEDRTRRIVYSGRLRSRLRRQVEFVFRPPRAAVVFDQFNDFPLIRGRYNLHVDGRDLGSARVERDGLVVRTLFLARWVWAWVRCVAFSARVRPFRGKDRYG